MPFAGYSVAVKHFTGGLHHPCAAHIVGGFRYRLLRTALMVLGQVGVVSYFPLSYGMLQTWQLMSALLSTDGFH